MLMLNRKKNKAKKIIGITVAMVGVAHLVAGALVCKGMQNSCSWQKMAQKAKRTVVGLVREII